MLEARDLRQISQNTSLFFVALIDGDMVTIAKVAPYRDDEGAAYGYMSSVTDSFVMKTWCHKVFLDAKHRDSFGHAFDDAEEKLRENHNFAFEESHLFEKKNVRVVFLREIK